MISLLTTQVTAALILVLLVVVLPAIYSLAKTSNGYKNTSQKLTKVYTPISTRSEFQVQSTIKPDVKSDWYVELKEVLLAYPHLKRSNCMLAKLPANKGEVRAYLIVLG